MKIIGLTGPSGVGKSTVATILAEQYGFYPEAFATPFKKMVCALLDRDYDLDDPDTKQLWILGEPKLTLRHLMQTLGTEWGREMIHPDLWVRLLKQRLERQEILRGYEDFVISDVRFENEAAFVRRHGVLWHIKRDVPALAEKHKSETPVAFDPNYDYTLLNHGSFAALEEQIARLGQLEP